jgi:hypothetical protein
VHSLLALGWRARLALGGRVRQALRRPLLRVLHDPVVQQTCMSGYDALRCKLFCCCSDVTAVSAARQGRKHTLLLEGGMVPSQGAAMAIGGVVLQEQQAPRLEPVSRWARRPTTGRWATPSEEKQRDAGASIPALVQLLLEGGSDEARSGAARTLYALCLNHSSNQQQAADAAVIRALER